MLFIILRQKCYLRYIQGHQPSMPTLVEDFVAQLPKGRVYNILADSYYGSLKTAYRILKYNCYFLLCCKSDRPGFLFSKLMAKSVEKYSATVLSNSRILAIRYRGKKKYVNFLTNIFQAPLEKSSSKYHYKVIEFYDKHRGHIDLIDASLSQIRWSHKNYKWTKAAFIGMLYFALYNSWVVFKLLDKTNIDFSSYLHCIVKEITNQHSVPELNSQHEGFFDFMLFDIFGTGRNRCHSGSACGRRTQYLCPSCKQYYCLECFLQHRKVHLSNNEHS